MEVQNDCYRKAAEAAIGRRCTLVHGYPTGTGGVALGLKYGHAWCEYWDGRRLAVFDPSGITISRKDYYRVGKIDRCDCIYYPPAEVVRQLAKHEHWGPWGVVPTDAVFHEE